jgi:CHASE2 domain-containing sensor protein
MFCAVFTIAIGLVLSTLRIGEGLVHLSYDLPFAFGSVAISDDVVIVRMDEESNVELHQSSGQWNRKIHAQLVDKLRLDTSTLAVFDVFFADPGNEEDNSALAKAIKAHGKVVVGAELEPIAQAALSQPRIIGNSIRPPMKEFRAAAMAWGITDVLEDTDSAVRRHFPGTDRYPSLAWVAAVIAGAPITDSVEDRTRERWIRYYGGERPITTLSYDLALDKPAGYFKGKIVFIGGKPRIVSPGESGDLFRTPYTRWTGNLTSGVEIHATILLNLMRGDWLTRLSAAKEFSLLALAGLLFGLGLNLVRPLAGIALALIGILAVTQLALWSFWHSNVWFSWVVIAGVQIPFAWMCSFAGHSLKTSREKDALEKELSTRRYSAELAKLAIPEPSIKSIRACAVVPDHELLRCVGKGAFGEVWLARTAIGTYHAVKIVSRGDFSSADSYAREFKGIEKYMPISLNHAGLIHILQVGRNDEGGYYYCVMEAGDDEVSGPSINPQTYSPRNLAKDLRKRGKLPLEECVSMTLTLTDALEFLHQHQLIHRDIKPSNIIFVNGVPKLADIGLVTEVVTKADAMTQLGTEGYMAPEVTKTAAADVYSLGKVIYEASMGLDLGRFPELPASLLDATNAAPLLRLNAIILKACEENVSKRYRSVSELRADLLDLQRQFFGVRRQA